MNGYRSLANFSRLESLNAIEVLFNPACVSQGTFVAKRKSQARTECLMSERELSVHFSFTQKQLPNLTGKNTTLLLGSSSVPHNRLAPLRRNQGVVYKSQRQNRKERDANLLESFAADCSVLKALTNSKIY